MKKPEMYHPGVQDETIGIKDHMEHECPAMESADMLYLGGKDPGQYSEHQNNLLAQNIRRHHAK